MKKELSKTEAKKEIDDFFKRIEFTPDELRKVKRLAMKYNLKFGEHRKRFCKFCLFPLKGKISVTKTQKTIICSHCQKPNKHSF
jgi:hypothetical protein